MRKMDRICVRIRLSFNKWYLHKLKKQIQRSFIFNYSITDSVKKQEKTIAALERCLQMC